MTVECQMVVLPQKAALPLIPDLLDPAKIDAACARVQDLIAKGEAELAANLVVKTSEDVKAVAETIEEVRYATEFDPPQLPQNAPDKAELLKQWPVTGVTPTAFETRNVGTSLEVEPTLMSAGRLWRVKVTPAHVRFVRWAKTDAGKLANGEHIFVEQPIFHSVRNVNEVVLAAGQRALLGVHKLLEPKDTLELFLLRFTAAPVKAP